MDIADIGHEINNKEETKTSVEVQTSNTFFRVQISVDGNTFIRLLYGPT